VLRCHQHGRLVGGNFPPVPKLSIEGEGGVHAIVARRRSMRALGNDGAIRTAAVTLVLRDGIDAISFRDVGRIAGLTHGALYARFEDVEELLVDLWNEVLNHRAVGLFRASMEATSNPDQETVKALFDFVRNALPTDAAMVQVLLSSRRFPILREEVDTFIHEDLETISIDVSNANQSRALLVFGLITVQILQNTLFGLNDADLDFLQAVVLDALQVNPNEVEPVELREPSDRIILAPNGDLRSQLAFHTFGAVGKSGYTRATISRISRRASCSPGAIYKLYPSKEDLVIAATRKIMEAPWITLGALAEILDEGALAQLLFSAASSQNDVRKSFNVEIAMASGHSDKIRAAVETQLQGLEILVPFLDGVSDEQKNQLRYVIRAIIAVTLGTSFLSTITKATDQIDFNQFAEPLRRSILQRDQFPWPEISRQLKQLAGSGQTPLRRP
jgi:AcrR family transcriptional regulator